MTAEEIKNAIDYIHCETYRGRHYKTITQALEKELERVENKSLSIDEIKNCIGEPLWVELKDGAFECLVLKDFNDSAFEFEDSVIFYSEDEPNTYVYKYKPREVEQ